MKGHRSDIKHNRNKPVAKHFNKPDHTLDNLKLAVIKEVKGKTKQQWEVEEQKIIFKLDCVNQGLNKDYSFMSNYSFMSIAPDKVGSCPRKLVLK